MENILACWMKLDARVSIFLVDIALVVKMFKYVL